MKDYEWTRKDVVANRNVFIGQIIHDVNDFANMLCFMKCAMPHVIYS